MIGEGALDASAGGPAGLVGALPIGGGVDDDVAEGDATGGVEQDTVGGEADAGADGGEPVILGFALCAICGDGGAGGAIAVHPGAVEIALEADHPTTGPPVEARSTANHAATTWERGESGQIDPGADSASSRVCRPRESFQAPLPLISLISDSYRVMRTAPLVAMPLCRAAAKALD